MASDIQTKEYQLTKSTPEEIQKVKRVVAGSQACQGAKDAELIFEALGFIPIRRT